MEIYTRVFIIIIVGLIAFDISATLGLLGYEIHRRWLVSKERIVSIQTRLSELFLRVGVVELGLNETVGDLHAVEDELEDLETVIDESLEPVVKKVAQKVGAKKPKGK